MQKVLPIFAPVDRDSFGSVASFIDGRLMPITETPDDVCAGDAPRIDGGNSFIAPFDIICGVSRPPPDERCLSIREIIERFCKRER